MDDLRPDGVAGSTLVYFLREITGISMLALLGGNSQGPWLVQVHSHGHFHADHQRSGRPIRGPSVDRMDSDGFRASHRSPDRIGWSTAQTSPRQLPNRHRRPLRSVRAGPTRREGNAGFVGFGGLKPRPSKWEALLPIQTRTPDGT